MNMSLTIANSIGDAENAIKKSLLVLQNIIDEYPASNDYRTEDKERADAWKLSYIRVYNYAEIAIDYTSKALELLERAVELDREQRNFTPPHRIISVNRMFTYSNIIENEGLCKTMSLVLYSTP